MEVQQQVISTTDADYATIEQMPFSSTPSTITDYYNIFLGLQENKWFLLEASE